MTHRVNLYRPTAVADDFTPADSADELVAQVLASIEPRSGGEGTVADQQVYDTQVVIATRWGPTIAGADATWWATWFDDAANRERRYEVQSVRDVGGMRRRLEFIASETNG